MDTYELERSKVASFPHLVETAARTMLNNRALSVALLQLDSDHARYADICRFLDGRVMAMVESARKLPPPPEEPPERDDCMETWHGAEVRCAGRTQNGMPCNARPYCRRHHPQYASALEANRQFHLYWDDYHKWKSEILTEYGRLAPCVEGLHDMNWRLEQALKKLCLPIPEQPEVNKHLGQLEPVRVDGLDFSLEKAWLGTLWLRREWREALLYQDDSGTEHERWTVFGFSPHTGEMQGGACFGSREQAVRYGHLYAMLYEVRKDRLLDCYRTILSTLVEEGTTLTSPAPLRMACNIDVPRPAWHVFHRPSFPTRNYACLYSGDSEAEARFRYAEVTRAETSAVVLLNPAYQVLEHWVDRRSFW